MSMLASPVKRELIRTGKYGKRGAGAGGVDAPANHLGVDFRAAIGTPVYAPIAGTVVQITRDWRAGVGGRLEGSRIFASYMAGNVVVVRGYLPGVGGVDVILAHLDSVSARLQVGDTIDLNHWLGASGRTGVIEAHVHLGVYRLTYLNGRVVAWTPIDPTPLLPWDGDKFQELKIGALKPADPPKHDAPASTDQEDPAMFDIVDSPNHKHGLFVCSRGTKPIKSAAHRTSLEQALAERRKAGPNQPYRLGKYAEQRLRSYFRWAW